MRQQPADEADTIEVDGQRPTSEQLAALALDSYGHFTAMQVRNNSVRGLAFHLARLAGAHREMFGAELDTGAVRGHIRHALAARQAADASVRVYVRHQHIMVTTRPPGTMPQEPWRLKTVPYQRAVAQIKHLSDFGQAYYQRQVRAAGFDEALLTGSDGAVSEGSITNIGFHDGSDIVWPDAPALAGITMQVLTAQLGEAAGRRENVRIADLGKFRAAFVTNARGIAPVGVIDDLTMPVDPALMTSLLEAYESAAWDAL
jgi:branched-subunit amino acid aminotransferase/4-amino-4-deoxychorismate lyase